MKNTWFTADPHLGHKGKNSGGIIKLANRPFSSIEEMDNIIINNFNQCVMPDDDFYILGDFAFDDHDQYLSRINGKKYLVRGNHDHNKRLKKATLWEKVYGEDNVYGIVRLVVDSTELILCHFKQATWYKSHKGTLHLYGHSHGGYPGDSQCCDVGVDAWNFKPVTLRQIKKRLATQPKRIEIDHHQPDGVDEC